MVETSQLCRSCGSHSVPKGARFCPECGSNLRVQSNNVPIVAAFPVAHGTSTNNSTTSSVAASTNAAAARQSAVAPQREEPEIIVGANDNDNADADANNASGGAPAEHSKTNATMIDTALFWKHPSPVMLERAPESSKMGQVLFVGGATGSCRGKFTVPRTIHAGNILSGARLDLSVADFVHPISTISVGAILGGFILVVPRGVRVDQHGFGILGGFDGLGSQNVNAGQVENAPLVIIQGFAILGGVKVMVNESVPPVQVVEQ